MIRNLFGGDSKCRTIDKVDIFGDSSGVALYQLDGNANDTGGNYHGTETAITYGGGVYERGAIGNGSTSKIKADFPLSTTMTISCWGYLTTLGQVQFIFGETDTTGTDPSTRVGLGLTATNNYQIALGNGTLGLNNTSVTSGLVINTWYHFSLVIDGTSVKLYTNGALVANLTSTVSIGSHVTGNFAFLDFGNYATAGAWNWNGSIDQVRIFNRAITATEVATLYAECAPTSTVDNINPFMDGSLKALYKFDGDATDATGVYNGTATNVTYGTGKFGQCAVFNGTSSKVDFTAISTAVAVSFWTNKTLFNTGTLDKAYMGTTSTTSFIGANEQSANFTNETLSLYYFEGTAKGVYITDVINDSSWKHIVIQFVSTGVYNIYVNGIKRTVTYFGTSMGNSISLLNTIGNFNSSSWFNANLDQIRFFNKALTPLEVASLYNETTPLEEPMYKLVDPFRDGSGKALYRMEGNALDESGNYNGTATSVTYGSTSIGREAIFNGTDSKILLGTTIDEVGTSDFSVSLWGKHSDIVAQRLLFQYGRAGDASQFCIGTYCSNEGNINITAVVGNAVSSTNWVSALTKNNDGLYHNYVVTREGLTLSMYMDSVLIQSKTITSISLTSVYQAKIGCGEGTDVYAYFYHGSIDQVRILNRALTQAEVTKLYAGENNVL